MMTPRQQWVFEMYLRLESGERSLSKLAAVLRFQGTTISLRTLETWSSRFGWQRLVQNAETEIARRISEQMAPIHAARTARELDCLYLVREQFFRKVENDAASITTADFDLYERALGGQAVESRPDGPSRRRQIKRTST